jgi:glycogen operon protein
VDDSFLILFNAHDQMVTFTMPAPDWGDEWEVELETTHSHFEEEEERVYRAKESIPVEGRSIVVLKRLPGIER